MRQIYFSGLNGLRAIAAIAVVFSHTTIELDQFGLNSFIFGKFSNGNPKSTLLAGFGVSIFFALSGFLITYLLLEEKKAKEINIKNFYIRRILRIWPLYYLYLLLSILTSLIFDLPFEIKYLLFYIFLLANVPSIFGGIIKLLAHYWSLGVEEQFYSFWPWVIKKSNSILKVTTLICLSLILLKCGLKFNDIYLFQGKMKWMYQIINVTRFHCMLIGAIGAILYFQNNSLFLRIINNLISQAISWLVILLIAINKFPITFLDNEFISVITVFLIIGQIQKTNKIINLDIPFFNFIGKISYGIYVIHPLIIFYLSKVMIFSDKSNTFNYMLVYFSVFLTTIILAYLSYEFFEKRFLSLKEKYSTIKTY
ncbi:MAG: acyltransferase family protein [Bacteroidia bacterium]